MNYVKTVRPNILDKKYWKKTFGIFKRLNKKLFIKDLSSYITEMEHMNEFRMDLMSEMIDHKADRNKQLDLYLQVGSPRLIEKHKLR